jgi:hypothetical protein
MFLATLDNRLSTNIPWDRPSLPKLQKWWDTLTSNHNMESYEVYLVGAFSESLGNKSIETWDVDIVLLSDSYDYNELKSIMDSSVIIGWENQLLIDISLQSDYYYSYFQNMYKGEMSELDESKMKAIRNYTTFEKSHYGELIYKVDLKDTKEIKKLIDGLYEVKGTPSITLNKAIDRLTNGIYKGTTIDLKEFFTN